MYNVSLTSWILSPAISGFYTSVYNNHYISLVFHGNSVKLYPDVDKGYDEGLTSSLLISIEKNGTFYQKQISSDRRCFTIHVSDDHEQ